MSKRAALTIHRRFPKELFRLNSGWRVNLRLRTPTGPSHYDIATATPEEVKVPVRSNTVIPKALDPAAMGYECEFSFLRLSSGRVLLNRW